MAYLDHNASAPLSPEALAAIQDELRNGPGNPSSVHTHGRRQRAMVENQRRKLARVIGGVRQKSPLQVGRPQPFT